MSSANSRSALPVWIRKSRDLAVGPTAIFEIQTDLVLPTFLEVVIEEVVGHVEPLWKRRIHGAKTYALRLRLKHAFQKLREQLSSSGLLELNFNAKPISEAASTTSAQKLTVC